ncbi:hypothetical protein [Falsiroseomonas ponticola]|uniref:hypothetical protein n=1 Tax=Falsiroseomonas ponticola TaxID=2786951 RepID=UPI00193314F9|nr:hypothetical protein [Roseomonas ponticola]
MSGTVPLREAALATIADRLTAQLSDVAVERARRAPVDTDAETLPRLVVRGDDLEADDSQEPGRTHYRIAFGVTGFAVGTTDLAAEQALSLLHARTVAALAGWTPATPGLGDIAEQGGEFRLYEAEDSSRPAGEFLARFTILAIGLAGGPWSS